MSSIAGPQGAAPEPSAIMADLAVAPAPSHPSSAPTTDLFEEPIEGHPPWFKPDSFLHAYFDPDAYVA